VSVLLSSALLMGLGLSIALLGSAETTLAAHDRDARTLSYASRAAVALALSDLRALPSWTDVGKARAIPDVSATPGRFVDASLLPTAPWGGPLDLRALTARLQAESDAASGTDRPVWRLFIYGGLDRLLPEPGRADACYLVVWVADDHGVLLARGGAFASGEGRAMTEISAIRQREPGGPDLVRLIAVRPGL
jgi:hypothetical protein